MVSSKDVIAIFDLRMTEMAHDTQQFLKKSKEDGQIIVIDPNDSKSFILTNDHIYYSPISSLTLKKRAGYLDEFE